jgi:alpha-amylase/alpha-mannosidase (GH57 family)
LEFRDILKNMERYICIHGHFYQPPRENPWLERVEWQESAYPYHDWNERITAECYLPNASSRILDGEGYISRIVNNYARMSFNFGPTLLAWMESNNPDVYRAIIAADRQSQASYSGHGSALAQAYNHMILPLANHRDRYTQVSWGIRDFEHRFGRRPEGMWLPETAVDLETLDILAELGIKFTILAPHQARRVRRPGASTWKEVGGGSIDTTQAYLVNMPSGRRFNLFFYDKTIAGVVSFGDLLKSGDNFAGRLISVFSDKSRHPQLVHIATDGETYGHHHRFGDMALAYALDHIEANHLARLTDYGEFLEKFPPTYEVEIVEKTSWSCGHGIDRWWSDCGDATGSGNHPDWNQKWRTPLRNAFDWLRDALASHYEEKARQLLKDPWAARDGYIDVVLDRSPDSVKRFFAKYAGRELNEDERVTALKLLELQRHAMLMYTSDGWYFDELSRPEPVQVMQYAGRVVQLARDLFGVDVEEGFLKILEQAKSNIKAQGDGRRIYNSLVRPAMRRAEAGTDYDEQHNNLQSIVESALAGIEKDFRSLFERLYPPEYLSAELAGPVPSAFQSTEELIINNALHRAVKDVPVDAVEVRELVDAAAKWQITLDAEGIGYDFKLTLEKMMSALAAEPADIDRLKSVLVAVSLARGLPFPVDLWEVQNIFWDMMNGVYPRLKLKKEWADSFITLGGLLNILVK